VCSTGPLGTVAAGARCVTTSGAGWPTCNLCCEGLSGITDLGCWPGLVACNGPCCWPTLTAPCCGDLTPACCEIWPNWLRIDDDSKLELWGEACCGTPAGLLIPLAFGDDTELLRPLLVLLAEGEISSVGFDRTGRTGAMPTPLRRADLVGAVPPGNTFPLPTLALLGELVEGASSDDGGRATGLPASVPDARLLRRPPEPVEDGEVGNPVEDGEIGSNCDVWASGK